MGCGASSNAISNIEFKNGKPDFKYDQITKGFDQGNGLLFRMENHKKKQWAYYNDSTEYEMHVKITFSEDSQIRALGKTSLSQQDDGKWLASVVVYPTETELFIEGTVVSFQAKMDALPLSDEYRANRAEKKK